MATSKLSPTHQLILSALLTIGGTALGAGGMYWFAHREQASSEPDQHTNAQHATEPESPEATAKPEPITFAVDRQKSANLKTAPTIKAVLQTAISLTGKIAMNDDRVAHIFPQIDGVVDQVKVQYGQQVKKGDELVVIRSREVGQAKLALYQDRLLRDFAATKNRWTEEVSRNTIELIQAIKANTSIADLENRFRERIMGEYREKLMTAYVSLYRSQMDLQRLSSLTESNTIPAKQRMAAEAAVNADQAILQASLEQIEQDAQRTAILAAQALREAEVKVSVSEANFSILGYDLSKLANIDPSNQGEALSFYPIVAPFDGTVIEKDIVLLERALPDRKILTIADLSSVWLKTDIYEEHLPLLKQLSNQTIRFHSQSWPGRNFEAKVFFTGEVVDEGSRTVAMIATAENSEGLLKPGMFVNVEIPSLATAAVIQVPPSAVLDHQGDNFVFVAVGPESFERRSVKIGRRSETAYEIVEGLSENENIVIEGGFALKSQMLAELIAGE